jgi:hypothetical protein
MCKGKQEEGECSQRDHAERILPSIVNGSKYKDPLRSKKQEEGFMYIRRVIDETHCDKIQRRIFK